METSPGEEVRVDFGRGAAVIGKEQPPAVPASVPHRSEQLAQPRISAVPQEQFADT